MSAKDKLWTHEVYKDIFLNGDPATISLSAFIQGLRKWEQGMSSDPGKRTVGKLERQANGAFEDAELVKVLQESTEDVVGIFTYDTTGFLSLTGHLRGTFGACNVPAIMKAVEILGMEQARGWKVATTLEALYGDIDLIELYPGVIAEQAAFPDKTEHGLCPGSTISQAMLLNTVTLVRGDRSYTVVWSPCLHRSPKIKSPPADLMQNYTFGSLTNWGHKQISSDPYVAGGGMIYKLLMRAYPGFYSTNSVYAMFPFTIPCETCRILQTLGRLPEDYDFNTQSFVGSPIPITSWTGATNVLNDQTKFKSPVGPRIWSLSGHDYI